MATEYNFEYSWKLSERIEDGPAYICLYVIGLEQLQPDQLETTFKGVLERALEDLPAAIREYMNFEKSDRGELQDELAEKKCLYCAYPLSILDGRETTLEDNYKSILEAVKQI